MRNNKRLCIIQMHYTDITEYLKDYNAVKKIIESNIFDDIIIAAADIPENECLVEWSKWWNTNIRFGSVTNVTQRVLDIVNEFSSNTILRILPQWYFIDVPLIEKMVWKLEETHSDFIKFPLDFDIRFGGDVFSHKFIKEIANILAKDSSLLNEYKFNPWGYADTHEEEIGLNILEFRDVPIYDNSQFKRFKTLYNSIWPEHWDTADSPQFPYQFATKYIDRNKSKVLDIACGFGVGSKHLCDSGARQVIGVDVSEDAIAHCISKYMDVQNLAFIEGDALNIDFDECSFDLIISIHTMEHVLDDNLFLLKTKSWLKKQGIYCIEVPLLMKYPFKYSNEPYSDAHIREYYTDDLIELFSRYFKIKESYGVCRGYYTNLDKARNAVLLIGEKSF